MAIDSKHPWSIPALCRFAARAVVAAWAVPGVTAAPAPPPDTFARLPLASSNPGQRVTLAPPDQAGYCPRGTSVVTECMGDVRACPPPWEVESRPGTLCVPSCEQYAAEVGGVVHPWHATTTVERLRVASAGEPDFTGARCDPA